MKQKVTWYLLGAEALACTLFSVINSNSAYSFFTVMRFPFEQIAALLRILSLSGFIGNLIAIVIYILICSLPVLAYLLRRKKNIIVKEDMMLILLSIILFAGLYLMINPPYLSNLFMSIGDVNFGFIAVGSTIYSVIIGYVVLRVLSHAFKSEAVNLIQGLKVLLFILAVFFIFNLFGSNVSWLITTIKKVAAGNTEVNANMHMTNVFIVIQYIFKSIPAALELWIIYHCNRLLTDFSIDRFSERSVNQTEYIVGITKKSIIAIVWIYIVQNIGQLIFSKMLLDMNYAVNIPISSLIFIFVILLASKYLSETRVIKNENDMIV
ncbi:MAG: hypothetical protein JXQ23_01555 [Clostridia bacterium]|nr:hypothetical protein [Clostridia bacterium]